MTAIAGMVSDTKNATTVVITMIAAIGGIVSITAHGARTGTIFAINASTTGNTAAPIATIGGITDIIAGTAVVTSISAGKVSDRDHEFETVPPEPRRNSVPCSGQQRSCPMGDPASPSR